MSGNDTPNHSNIKTMSVPNGTAVEDCRDHATKLIKKKIAKHTPGNKSAVSSVALK